jgi:hypothetical protein
MRANRGIREATERSARNSDSTDFASSASSSPTFGMKPAPEGSVCPDCRVHRSAADRVEDGSKDDSLRAGSGNYGIDLTGVG